MPDGRGYRRAGRRIEIEDEHAVTIAVPMPMFQEFIFPYERPTEADRRKVEIWGAGTTVFFPRLESTLDAHATLRGIFGSREWMDTHATHAGAAIAGEFEALQV
ncbi:hypothetical protein [Paraburkholderia domus]|uniref:DUF2442 domain-containing protein n=1 Tax=Paraburkholderia domus TaxID=2793075 RepID=A0A9N8R568_9BURK|nr:hypothetical protein [Paraburkholderia domus]MBK5169937.1 hypothetical protein [Burkholderia sp. R-70211]CAE6967897.1 hypothetical protein R70211_07539 [Paraburkholderia domus]